MSDEWIAANKEYMKFQKMNPIFGMYFNFYILLLYSILLFISPYSYFVTGISRKD